MQTLRAGVCYFLIVFGMGFIFGTIRTLWVVPRVGVRSAELMEAPCMLVVTLLTARWIVQQFALPAGTATRLGVGLVGLGFLLAAEFGLVFWVRGLSLKAYLISRDPVSGMVYYLLLGLFAVMPLLVARG